MLGFLPFPTGLLWPQKIRKRGAWEAEGRGEWWFLARFFGSILSGT